MKIIYTSNNSGGSWWLTDEDWRNLESAGWKVRYEPQRHLGALAYQASKDFESVGDAIQEFEKVTGQAATEEGCECCGAPHCFSWDDGSVSGASCIAYLKDLPSRIHYAIYGKSDDPEHPDNRDSREFLAGYGEGFSDSADNGLDRIGEEWKRRGCPEIATEDFQEWKRGYNAGSMRDAWQRANT